MEIHGQQENTEDNLNKGNRCCVLFTVLTVHNRINHNRIILNINIEMKYQRGAVLTLCLQL